jgi:DNA-binding transcriptional LysR family regulator
MELRQLRYFVALAEELHYGEAAARLRISKPTLSQQVSVLERDLAAPLLERSARSVRLTPAGAVLLGQAREILAACDRARASVAAAHDGERALDVRIANGIAEVLGERLEAVAERSGLRLNWALTSSLDAEDAVLNGRADAAITWVTAGRDTTLHATAIAAPAVWLAVPEGHRLASASAIDVLDVADERIVLFPRALSPGVWDLFATHLQPVGTLTDRVIEVPGGLNPMVQMLSLVKAGKGVAPFVQVVAQAIDHEGVSLRPLHPPLSLPVQLVCRDPTRPDLRRLMSAVTGCGLQRLVHHRSRSR